MSIEFLDDLKRGRDIRIKPKFSGGKNGLQVYPRLKRLLRRFKLQKRATFKSKMTGEEDFSCIDSRFIYAKLKEFFSHDAVNASAIEEYVVKCCNAVTAL